MTSLADLDVVLASTSRYRRELLMRFTPFFRVLSPDVDETPLPEEKPAALAIRLAAAKAGKVAAICPGALIIGSDQVADLDGCALGKPGTAAIACQQLTACSGHRVRFHTAVCLVDTRHTRAEFLSGIDTTDVVFRDLRADEINRYVVAENPFDCAGSFKSEGLGIALFERIESSDPTGLIGLPLTVLARLLRASGVVLP